MLLVNQDAHQVFDGIRVVSTECGACGTVTEAGRLAILARDGLIEAVDAQHAQRPVNVILPQPSCAALASLNDRAKATHVSSRRWEYEAGFYRLCLQSLQQSGGRL